MVGKHGVTSRCRRAAFLRGVWPGVLAATYLLLVGLPAARADYIAEAKEGSNHGYLYIGKGMTKWQGSTNWSFGDLVVRDDKKVMYFMGLAEDPARHAQAESGPAPDAEARIAEARRQLEASGSVMVGVLSHPDSDEAPRYDTRIVSYDEVQARRQAANDRAMALRRDAASHAQSVEAAESAAMYDIFVKGKPTWTNTGETATIAGRQCTKYQVTMAPVFSADVWMTEDLGPGYAGGLMFDKVFDIYRGGVRPLEVLAEIPGFPLRISAQQKDVFGMGISQFEYEVSKLVETDLDTKEFDPKPGSRVYEGKLDM